jgi:type IV pilus assembly protein PilO
MAPPKAAAPSSLAKLPLPARVGLVVGLCLLVAVAYFVVGYTDIAKQIEAAQNTEKALRKELAEVEDSRLEYTRDLALLTEKQQRARELNKVLPETPDYPAFLSALQNVATVSGISLNSWDPLEPSPQQFFARVPMKLSLVGKFHQIAKFFYGVGQLDRIINLENITLGTPKKEGDDMSVKVDCLATAFHTLPSKTAASGTPATAAAPPGSTAPPAGSK